MDIKLVDVILDSDIDALEAIFYRKKSIDFTYNFTEERINKILKIIEEEINKNKIFENFNEVLIKQGIINHFNSKEKTKVFTDIGEKELLNSNVDIIRYSICGKDLTINYQNKDNFILPIKIIDCDDWEKMKYISNSIDDNVFNKYKDLKWIKQETKDYIYCWVMMKNFGVNKNKNYFPAKINFEYNFYIEFNNCCVIPAIDKNLKQFLERFEILGKNIDNIDIEINEDIYIADIIIQKGKYGIYEKDNSIKFFKGEQNNEIKECKIYLIEYLKCCLWILWFNKNYNYNGNKIKFDNIQFDFSYTKSKCYYEDERYFSYFIPTKNYYVDNDIIIQKDNISIKVSSNNMCLYKSTDEVKKQNAINIRNFFENTYNIDNNYTEQIFQKDLVNHILENNNYLYPLVMPDYKCKIAISDDKIYEYIKNNKTRWLNKIIDLAIKKGYIYVENEHCYYIININSISQTNKFLQNLLQYVIKENQYITKNIKINKEYNLVNKLLYFWGNENKKADLIDIEEYSFDNIKICYERMEENEMDKFIKYALSRLMFAWLLDDNLFSKKLNDAKKIHRTIQEFMEKNAELRKKLIEPYLDFISSLKEEDLYTERVLLMRSCFEKDDFETNSDEQKRYLKCFAII